MLTLSAQAEEIRSLISASEDLSHRLHQAQWVAAELSKGLAVAMRSLYTNQVCEGEWVWA
jgi:hypothetical protein